MKSLKSLLIALCFSTPLAWATPLPTTSFTGFDLTSQQKKSFSLTEKSPLVIVFLSSLCPCSHAHEESLKALAEEYGKKGVQFVGVHSNANEHTAEEQKKLRDEALPFPIIEDMDSAIANQFGALKTPHAYVVWQNKIVYQGGVDDSASPATAKKFYLKDALASIVLGKLPETERTRTLGCFIKR